MFKMLSGTSRRKWLLPITGRRCVSRQERNWRLICLDDLGVKSLGALHAGFRLWRSRKISAPAGVRAGCLGQPLEIPPQTGGFGRLLKFFRIA